MQIKQIISELENIAPLETQEEWDNSGWQILPENESKNIEKIFLCLSLTKENILQAKENHCELIISHHPFLFPHAVPIDFNVGIPIYSSHTPLDVADGGTTDSLIKLLGYKNVEKYGEFLRIVELDEPLLLNDFTLMLKIKLNLFNLRIVNNENIKKIKKIAFCAGSGADFLADAEKICADIFVTGDVKYHTALESHVIIADIGHFESERPVLETIKSLYDDIEVITADEKSPFINY